MKRPIVTHGHLIDVIGQPRAAGRFIFVAALLEIDDPAPSIHHLLENALPTPRPAILTRLESENYLAYWVRSRLAALVQYGPLTCHEYLNLKRSPLINLGFVAIAKSPPEFFSAIPFACCEQETGDEYDSSRRVGLAFSSHGPDATTQRSIAKAFWGLLFDNPHELSPFTYWYGEDTYDSFSWRKAGVDNLGFFDEEAFPVVYDDTTPNGVDGHFGFTTGDYHPCVDCDGTGLEGEYLARLREPCETCFGTGWISWPVEPARS